MAMFGGGQQLPKGDIQQLWQLLGVSMVGDEIVLQDYNPYPQIQFTPDFLIIDNEGLQAQGTAAPFNPHDPITSGMEQILLVRGGSLRKAAGGRTNVESLVVTGPLTGTVSYQRLASVGEDFTWNSNTQLSNESFIVAVRVKGEVESDEDELKALDLTQAGREGAEDRPDDPTPVKKNPINAIVVSDIDCLSDPFFQVREEGDRSWAQIPEFRFQNVAMVLNILDDLAGDDRFIEIRKRTPNRPGLTQIDAATKQARADTRKKIDEFEKQKNEQLAEAQKEFDDRLAAIDSRTDLSREQKSIMRARTMIRAQQKLIKERTASEQEHDRQVAATQRKLEQDIRAIQNRYKAFAFFLPPIPPILLGIFVFIHRRLGEREGVAKTRLRYTKNEPAA